jgi:Uma2 family endonuclease
LQGITHSGQCQAKVLFIEEYLLIDSRSVKVELYRKEQNKWVYYAFGAEDEVDLASLGVSFPVAEAYDGVEFEEGSTLDFDQTE